ncbi:MAG: ammonium transporter [Bacilli bacterium]
MNATDAVFMFVATVLVMLMTPGLALFYGGMVSSKNVLSTTMHSYGSFVVVALQWVTIGYSLSFGTSQGGLIGNLQWFGLQGVTFEPNPDYSANIPHNLFMMFQLMFAAITPAIISGAFAERIRFAPFLLFTLLWTTFVYNPVAHWVWGVGGWLRELGALDFAGGNVVHISSGVSGLVLAILIGKRKAAGHSAPHHLPMTILGAGLLFFGWFGFNAGSALTLDAIAMNAFITTTIAACAGAIGWIFIEWLKTKRPTVLGAISGLIGGLVSITPGCGFVNVPSAIAIGFLGGIICFYGVTSLKSRFGYDDTLDAFGIHGIGGTWGGIATGLFASLSVNELGANGLFFGDASLLGKELIAISATYLFSALMTYIIFKCVDKFMPIRVNSEHEQLGLDLSLHGEKAYHDAVH